MGKVGDYPISLGGTLPSDKRCGLGDIHGDLVKRPDQIRFAVIAYDVAYTKVPTDPGELSEPVLRIKRWEVAEGGDAQTVLNLIDAINGRREGSDAQQETLATTAELEAREAELEESERAAARDDAAASHPDGGTP